MVKTALAAMCACTLFATAYLTASLLILQPPLANYQQWAIAAIVILLQGALTLTALRVSGGKGLRYLTAAGGAGIVALGASTLYGTVSGPHFEGYALVLGSALVIQGLLTLTLFAGQGRALAQVRS